MGILGPKRTVLTDLASNTVGPFRTVDNDFSILDRADLVMIDPVGTGFSRPICKAEGKEFWGVDQDIKSVSDFIVRYLNQYGRWGSPKFILGESYGGMRSAGVAYTLLTQYHVALNGVILVSPYLDFSSGNAGLGMNDALRQFPAHICRDGVVPQRAAESSRRIAAVPARGRGVRAGHLCARLVQGHARHGRGATEGARRAGPLHGTQ